MNADATPTKRLLILSKKKKTKKKKLIQSTQGDIVSSMSRLKNLNE